MAIEYRGGEGGRTGQNIFQGGVTGQNIFLENKRYIHISAWVATVITIKSPNLLYRDGDESVCSALLGTILSFQDRIPSPEIPKT